MNSRLVCSAMAALLFAFTQPSVAHHASAPHFDSTTSVEFTGTVAEFKLVNPHAYLYVNVTEQNGNQATWNCEMNSASTMRRFGWTQELFPIGAEITVEGWAARRDELGCAFQVGTMADGTVVERSGAIKKAEEPSIADTQDNPDSELGAAGADLTSIAGTWVTLLPEGKPEGVGPWSDLETLKLKMTDPALEVLSNYDMRFDDPAFKCSPSSIVRGWGEPFSVSEITLTDETVTIQHGYMDTVRVVDLTSESHPEDIEPSLTGHSIGRFEDGNLIIDTVGFLRGVLLPHPGVMNSDQLRVVETISLEEGGTKLKNTADIFDSAYLKEPLQAVAIWGRTTEPLTEYSCVELGGKNNERPNE